MSDETLANVARNLAKALITYARDRRDDDRKTIAALQTELCAEYRTEVMQANEARK
jgi:hypothetical protein